MESDEINIENNKINEINKENKIYENEQEDDKIKKQKELILGTPFSYEYISKSKGWFIIETTKNYKFYYNKKSNIKQWNCPNELLEILNKNEIYSEDEKEIEIEQEKKIEKEKELEKKIEKDNSYENKKKKKIYKILKEYKELLKEKNVRKYTEYEKILCTILYDKRYLNVPLDMRKIYFEKFAKEINDEVKNEISILIKNFYKLIEKKKEKILKNGLNEKEIHDYLKHEKEFKGNKSKEWINIRNKMIKKYILKEKNYVKDKNIYDFSKYKNEKYFNKNYNIRKHKNENEREREKEKERERKRKRDREKEKEKESKKERKTKTNEYEIERERKNIKKHEKYIDNKYNRINSLNKNNLKKINDKRLFMCILSEKLKKPFVENNILMCDVYKEKISFDEYFKIPKNILDDEKYKNLSLNDNEKFASYKEYINTYIDNLKENFNRKLNNLSINYINESFEGIMKIINNENQFFEWTYKYLKDIYTKWKNYKINEVKKIFKNFLYKSIYIKHDSDRKNNYEKLIGILSKDISYKMLDFIPEERENMIKERVKELKKEHEKNKNIAEKLNIC